MFNVNFQYDIGKILEGKLLLNTIKSGISNSDRECKEVIYLPLMLYSLHFILLKAVAWMMISQFLF